MKKQFVLISALSLLIISLSEVYSQSYYSTKVVTDTIKINVDNHYLLSSVMIVPFTETVVLRKHILNKTEYSISYEKAFLKLSDSLAYSLFDTLFVTYETLKLGFKKVYKRRSLVYRYDQESKDSIRVIQLESSPLSSESIFGRRIEKSGTLIRGFTVGTTRDFTVNSGLRLQLSGKLSDEIEIVAALTDENSPIQPEGNTERLEELDKVFIEIRHPNAIGTFGDYDFNESIGEFGRINRKLQGLKGEFKVGSYNGVIALAGSRGKFNTNQFNGIDGLQGPYRLRGINNENDIIVIAGSEKIYIDGELMRRGENNDYTIEYGNAELSFTPKRVITSATRITVDFEYTDRQYNRNLFGVNLKTKFLEDKLKVKINFMQEGDNQNSPIDLLLSEDDKKILEEAGDDRLKAVRSGVTLVEPDSNGERKGIYTKVDSLVNGESFSYYIYIPGDSASIYDVQFSFVGEGLGDYVRESIGNYKFVGIKKGAYLPIKFLPLPELKQTGNIIVTANPFEGVVMGAEFAGSAWDKNRFSNRDNDDNNGIARNIFMSVEPTDINLGKISLGKIGLSYKDRFVQDRFTTLDRFNNIEFNRDYNISEDLKNSETLREIGLTLIPVKELSITSKYGFLKKGDKLNSKRLLNNVLLTGKNSYNLIYSFDYVESKNISISGTWLKQKGDASWTFGKIKPGVNFLSEIKKDRNLNSDSLVNSSLKFLEGAPYLQITDISGFNFLAMYSLRDEEFPLKGKLEKESRAITQNYQLKYRGIREVNSTLDITLRNKKFTEKFKDKGLLDNETVLIKSQTRLNFWRKFTEGDIYYETATKASSRLEKVFLKVPKGQGNYIYIGDLNNNGIADENEFELTSRDGDFIQTTLPTDELFPVVELKASTRWKFNFNKIFTKKNDFFGTLLNPISTETFLRVEENSTIEDTKKIYLLQFSHFLNDSTTVRGSNLLQQDIYLFRNHSDLSIRFRFIERNNLSNFTGGIERGFFRERSLRIKFKMVKEISNQTELINQNDNTAAPASSNRSRIVTSNSFISDFSYRPLRNLEVGFKFGAGRSQDDLPAKPTIIDNNRQSLRVNLSFENKGRLRAEAERIELTSNTTENVIPFEITRGNTIGKNYTWRLSFDYRIASNFQTTVSYDGRLQSGGKAIHTMRAEARAYF